MGAGIHKDELTWRELAASANLNSVRSRIEVYFFNRFTIEVQKWNITHLDRGTGEDRRQKCCKNGKKRRIYVGKTAKEAKFMLEKRQKRIKFGWKNGTYEVTI